MGFTAERLGRIRAMEGWHFWFRSREERLLSLLDLWRRAPAGRVLDVGCGTGHLSRTLRARRETVISLDMRFEPCVDAFGTDWLSPVQADVVRLPFASGSFATIIALDILEHVDDRAALDEMARVLAPGGQLFLTVPALTVLWSHRDRAAGHQRRYNRTGLAERVCAAGFDVQYVSYFQFVLLPLVWLTRLVGRATPRASDIEERPCALINAMFLHCNRIENRLSARVQWPLGSSLLLVARKP